MIGNKLFGWLISHSPSIQTKPNRESENCFEGIINPNNNAPVRVRSVKEFVVRLIEEQAKKDTEIGNLKKEIAATEHICDELGAARLMLEQQDLTAKKLREEVAELNEKLKDQKSKNRELKDQINDLKLKTMIKVRKPRKEKK